MVENKSRAQRRADEKARKKATSGKKVYLSIPEEFLDVMGEPWAIPSGRGESLELDFLEVLIQTIRQGRVQTIEEAERSLDLLSIVKEVNDDISEPSYIEFTRGDFDYMISHLRKTAHMIWLPPDAAFLIRYINEISTEEKPDNMREKLEVLEGGSEEPVEEVNE